MTTRAVFSMSLRREVDDIRDRHVAAVKAGHADAATDVFAPDGILLPPGQPALAGTSQIRTWFTHVFANFDVQGFGLQPATTEERGDVVIEHGSWGATFQPKASGAPRLPAAGTYLTIYARQSDGSVRIIRDTFNGMPG